MLSIKLYVKGCLDCTVGAFHLSIPAEPLREEIANAVHNGGKIGVQIYQNGHSLIRVCTVSYSISNIVLRQSQMELEMLQYVTNAPEIPYNDLDPWL